MAPFEDKNNSFVKYTDQSGNVLTAIVRDGTILTQGVTFADGTTQLTAGGAGPTHVSIPVPNSSPITVTPTQASGTVITLDPTGGGPNTGFTVIFPVSVKSPFAITNNTSVTVTINSTFAVNNLTIYGGQTGYFYIDAVDIWIYGANLQVEGVPATTINAGTISLNATGITTLTDQGGGQIQIGNIGGYGQNLYPFPPLQSATSASLQNQSLIIYLPAGRTQVAAGLPPKNIAFQMCVKSGTLTIGHMLLMSTSVLDMHVAGKSAKIAVSGVTDNITLNSGSGFFFTTDTFAVGGGVDLSNGSDAYLVIYFANVAGNATVTVGQTSSGVQLPEALVSGDATTVAVGGLINGGTPITSYATHTLLTWFEGTA